MTNKQNDKIETKKSLFSPASDKQKMILDSTATVTVVGGAAGCFSQDTEFLSKNGWKRIDQFKEGDEVLEYDINTGKTEFRKPLAYIKLPCDKLTRIEGNGIYQELSDEHTVLYKPDYHLNPRTLQFHEIVDRHNKSKTKGWTGKFMTTFNYSGNGIDLTEGELRLQVAVMADGTFPKNTNTNYCLIKVSKHRKHERLLELCNKFNLKHSSNMGTFNEKYSNNTEYSVSVYPKWKEKRYIPEFYNCSKEQLEIIFDEVFHWDGSIVKNAKTTTRRYFSKYKEDADFIQFVGAALGYNTTITFDNRENKPCYTVNVMESGKGLRSLANKDKKAEFIEFAPTDGYKYCFTTSTGFFVTRNRDCIVVTGNSGKSYLLTLMPLKLVDDKYTNCALFRRETTTLDDGIFGVAEDLYSQLPNTVRPKIRTQKRECVFKSGAKVSFKGMDLEKDKRKIQGHEYTFIGVDEATHFEWSQLTYMISRLRSKSKYASRIVMSCNPDPDHKLREIISWHLDKDGYPIPERDGVIRYFITMNGEWVFRDTKEELIEEFAEFFGGKENVLPVSFTFISATIYDNPVVLRDNPEYLANLMGLEEVERARLLHGNWFVRPQGKSYFKREYLKETDVLPMGCSFVRSWDKAADERSEENKYPDYTASIKIAKDFEGYYYLIGDYCPTNIDDGKLGTNIEGHFCKDIGDREKIILDQAVYDGQETYVILPQDPAAAGKAEFLNSSKPIFEAGFIVDADPTPSNRSKLTRFTPFANLAKQGFIKILRSSFSDSTYEALMKELESFDGQRSTRMKKDDWADAVASGINYLQANDLSLVVHIPRINKPTLYSSLKNSLRASYGAT